MGSNLYNVIMTIIEQVAQYLEDNSVGTVGTDIFLGFHPDSPNNSIAILDTGGATPDIDLTDIQSPTFQIIVRNTDHETGKTKVDTIRGLLHNKYNSTLISGQNYFYSINLVAEGGHVGRDNVNRDMFSMNFLAKLR
jgi:hypothetical protein